MTRVVSLIKRRTALGEVAVVSPDKQYLTITRLSRARRACVAALVLVTVLAGCTVSTNDGDRNRSTDQECAQGLVRGDADECVGVTDGAYSFVPELNLEGVLDKFKQENDRVVGEASMRPYWSIAVVVPLPRKASGLAQALRHELQGAYLAQHRANHTPQLGDRPAVRVLVANVGERANHWQLVAEMLNARVTDNSENLVALVGLGQSIDTTKKFIEHIERGVRTAPDEALPVHSRLPLIATRLTADNLSTNPNQERVIQGLVRISPTNSDQIAAVAAYLTNSRTLLIQDTNSNDEYTRSLSAAISKAFSGAPPGSLLEPERYDSSLPGAPNAFVQMMPGICIKSPESIYYGGRGEDLAAFLGALAGRPCPEKKMDVFTGDDGVDLTAKLRQQLAEGNEVELARALSPDSNISLRYTNLAHPDAWIRAPHLFHPQSIDWFQNCATCFTRMFPGETLDDGAAIASYDAVLVAIRAMRGGYSPGAPLDQGPGVLRQQIYRFNSTSPVQGASGPIFFDEAGKPVNKPIPILQLNPDGTLTLIDLVRN